MPETIKQKLLYTKNWALRWHFGLPYDIRRFYPILLKTYSHSGVDLFYHSSFPLGFLLRMCEANQTLCIGVTKSNIFVNIMASLLHEIRSNCIAPFRIYFHSSPAKNQFNRFMFCYTVTNIDFHQIQPAFRNFRICYSLRITFFMP